MGILFIDQINDLIQIRTGVSHSKTIDKKGAWKFIQKYIY